MKPPKPSPGADTELASDWYNYGLAVGAKISAARTEALEAALRGLADAVRTDVGAGYGWGAWLPDEYAGAERTLKMVADRARAALAPEQDK